MHYDKGKYEKLIIESPLFTIDKDSSPSLYDAEAYRMKGYLYCYLMGVDEQKYEPYGLEILTVAENCIRAFDSTKGEFLHYFNAAWKAEQKHIFGDEEIEKQYHGLKVKEQDIRLIRKIKRLLDDSGQNMLLEKLAEKVADMLEISVEETLQLIEMSKTSFTNTTVSDDEGNESDSIQQIADVFNIEDYFIDLEQTQKILSLIQSQFDSLQDRTKPIISDCVTVLIYPVLKHLDIKLHYSFLSDFVIDIYNKKGVLLSQRKIAWRHNRNEASISRTFGAFQKQLELLIIGENEKWD